MFRVLERAAGLLVVAPPERTARSRRPAVARDGRIVIPIEPASGPAASMPAPWGEPAEPFPWVVVSTRVWTDVWPRVATAATRATERPVSVAARAMSPDPVSSVAGATVPFRASVAEPVTLAQEVVAAEPVASRAVASGPAVRAARPRRGFVARLAMFALGLLVSMVAVEAASRASRR